MNKKSTQERVEILQLLVEGNSLHSTSSITGASINTVAKLLVDAGKACLEFQDKSLRGLSCKCIQCNEVWAFCHLTKKNDPELLKGKFGECDIWVWTGSDTDTKLIVSWMVGRRDLASSTAFVGDLASRLTNKMQLTTDGHKAYLKAIDGARDSEIDYAVLYKLYGNTTMTARHPSGQVFGTVISKIYEGPDIKHVSPSYVERQIITMQMSMQRSTCLTNGFSKKVENHMYLLALHFMHYNFLRIHKILQVTPAMEAKVTNRLWTLEDIVWMMDEKTN